MPNPTPPETGSILRQIPSVDELLATARIRSLLAAEPRWAILEAIREVLAERRRRALAGDLAPMAARALLDPSDLEAAVEAAARRNAGSMVAQGLAGPARSGLTFSDRRRAATTRRRA